MLPVSVTDEQWLVTKHSFNISSDKLSKTVRDEDYVLFVTQ